MRQVELRWTYIRVGLFVAIALFAAFCAVAALGIAGSPFARRAHLHGLFDDVAGLAVGSPVEMGGVIVGEITSIELPELETGKVPVRLAVDHSALERVGPSSVAFTGSHALVGQRFVGLTTRKASEPALKDGDTIQTTPSTTVDVMLEDARKTLTEVRGMIADVRAATGALQRAGDALDNGQGTLGLLLHDRELYDRLLATSRHADDLMTRLTTGDGAMATLIGDPAVGRDLKAGMGAFARTAERVQKGEGILGRLTTDGVEVKRLDATLANLETVSGKLADAQGTLGALISDPALLGRMNALLTEMNSLVADVRRNPQRYVKLQPF